LSISISSLVANVSHDLFIFDNAGVLTLEVLAWKKVTATNNPAAGSNIVINVPDTSGVVVGSLVTVKGGANNEIARVNTVVANTSITVDTLANAYTTPDIYYNSRATNIALQDGLYVKTGDSTRRYLGTFRITAVAGQCEDSKANRFLWNYYNRVSRKMVVIETATSWGYSTAAWRATNGNNSNRVNLVVGVSEDLVEGSVSGIAQTVSGNFLLFGVGVGLDSTTVDSSDIGGTGFANNTSGLSEGDGFNSQFSLYPGIGFHYLQWIEYAGGDRDTWYGTTGPARPGLKATILG
jgi:hypothetical protein